jgi:hypothetical protein
MSREHPLLLLRDECAKVAELTAERPGKLRETIAWKTFSLAYHQDAEHPPPRSELLLRQKRQRLEHRPVPLDDPEKIREIEIRDRPAFPRSIHEERAEPFSKPLHTGRSHARSISHPRPGCRPFALATARPRLSGRGLVRRRVKQGPETALGKRLCDALQTGRKRPTASPAI